MITAARMRYYAVAAHRAGVPEFWIQDAVQDIAIRVWRTGNDRVMVVRSAAIDAARKYGRYGRSGFDRASVDIDGVVLITDPWDSVDWCIDAKAALTKLRPWQQKALAGWADRKPRNSDQVMRGQARRRLRQLMVGPP